MSLQESIDPTVHGDPVNEDVIDLEPGSNIDTQDKYCVVQTAIDVLEPKERMIVMRALGEQITSPSVRRLYVRDLQYLDAFIVSEHGRNTISAAFMNVYRKNPPFVIFAMLCIAGLVFKLGYSLTNMWTAFKTFGIWGG